MTVVALSTGWYVGWAIGLVVVLIAATLLVAIIALGQRITRQAADIERALAGTRPNTDPLWDVRQTNQAIARITRGLATARERLSG